MCVAGIECHPFRPATINREREATENTRYPPSSSQSEWKRNRKAATTRNVWQA